MKTLLLILFSFTCNGQSLHEMRKQIRVNERSVRRIEMQNLRIENFRSTTPKMRRIETISTGCELGIFLLTLAMGHQETDHPNTNFAHNWNQKVWSHSGQYTNSPQMFGYHWDAFHLGNSLGRTCLMMIIAKEMDKLWPTPKCYNGKLKRWIEIEVVENVLYNSFNKILNK